MSPFVVSGVFSTWSIPYAFATRFDTRSCTPAEQLTINTKQTTLVGLHSSTILFCRPKRGQFINQRPGDRLCEPAAFPNLTPLA
jgi:hypothetical protein